MNKEIENINYINLLDEDLASGEEYQDKYLAYVAKLRQQIKLRGINVSVSKQKKKVLKGVKMQLSRKG